jgi:glycosyltransferase involved in cell wall biosynthesis
MYSRSLERRLSMKATAGTPTGLRVCIQADQLSSSAGGGRFVRGFLSALFNNPHILAQLGHVYVVATQNENTACLGSIPSNVSVVNRRFPSRLRGTPLAALFGYTLPVADVSFGPFYYTFPSRAKARIITVHDLSCFNEQYHPPASARRACIQLTRMVKECDGVVCISYATLCEFQKRWPQFAHKAVMIYCGASDEETKTSKARKAQEHTILAVGTIEPRKNYSTLLDAFERLVNEQGNRAPLLVVVGNLGWMSESVVQRLSALQAAGRCRWLRNASDEQLAEAYGKAGVFTYLSLSEGFGYPPFEAAFARCPMVISSKSSVGEIWSGYAKCVDPLNIEEIMNAWQWALALKPPQREYVVACQEKRAREFTWSRTINEYIAFWKRSVSTSSSMAAHNRSVAVR